MMFFSSILFAQLADKESNKYKTVKIGDYEWMSENLRSTKLNDGKSIALAKNKDEWMVYCKKSSPVIVIISLMRNIKIMVLSIIFTHRITTKLLPKGGLFLPMISGQKWFFR